VEEGQCCRSAAVKRSSMQFVMRCCLQDWGACPCCCCALSHAQAKHLNEVSAPLSLIVWCPCRVAALEAQQLVALAQQQEG
jgi:hypothetical protein